MEHISVLFDKSKFKFARNNRIPNPYFLGKGSLNWKSFPLDFHFLLDSQFPSSYSLQHSLKMHSRSYGGLLALVTSVIIFVLLELNSSFFYFYFIPSFPSLNFWICIFFCGISLYLELLEIKISGCRRLSCQVYQPK